MRRVIKQVIFLVAHRNRLFIHLASPDCPSSHAVDVTTMPQSDSFDKG